MSDIKWIKLNTNMHEDEKMRLIDAMPERDTVHYLWIRLLIQAGKTNSNGSIFLNENIPYTNEMLATIFNRPLESIKFALKTLSDFEMIEIAPNNVIKIVNWDKHQNIEGMERVRAQNRKRAENHREKKKQIEKTTKENQEEEKQNNDEVKVQDNDEVKVQENQRENSKVRVKDNENIVPLDKPEVNSKTNIVGDANDIENTIEGFISNKNNSSDIIENSCNVTENESNVTVTEQNKREIENKNKKEIENKSNKSNNISDDINNKGSTHGEEVKESSLSQSENCNNSNKAVAQNNINSKAIELLTHYEQITGIIGVFNLGAITLAIDMHGENNVKMAIDRALEVNKHDMSYINGILKNWRREGYPKQREEIKNGVRSTGKSNAADKNEFTGFKPKKPRNLTESERKGAEEKLI